MKQSNYIKISMILGALALSACAPTSNSSNAPVSFEPISSEILPEANSLKGAMTLLNKSKNYTADVTLNGKYYYSIFVTPSYVGTDGNEQSALDMKIFDGEGIYPLNYCEGSMVSGEYELDENGENLTNLFDNSIAYTLYDVSTDYLDEIKASDTSIEIEDKFYKLALLDYIGINKSFFVDLNTVTAKYDETKGFNIDLKFIQKNTPTTYSLYFYDFGTTKNDNVETFLKEEGTVYTPDLYMATMTRLLKSNNFVSNVYNFSESGDGTGDFTSLNQVFNPHYFYSTSGELNNPKGTKQGYISFNRSTPVTNTSSPYFIPGFDTQPKGIYMFVAEGARHSIAPNVVYENPDMEYFMHYPSLLKLLKKTQFFHKGTIKEHESKYTSKSHCYVLNDSILIKDFASNFSLTDSFPVDQCVPYALGVEVNIGSEDKYTTIIFHYCMRYQGSNYDYLIPLFSFGETNNEHLDAFYSLYND